MLDVIQSSGTVVLTPEFNASLNQWLASTLALMLNALVGFGIAAVRKWMKSKDSTWKQKIAFRLVCFAGQRFMDNKEKLDYVTGKLAGWFPRISKEEIDHLIEEAVVQLKAATTSSAGGAAQTPPTP